MASEGEPAEVEYEVEDILRYRRKDDGEEYFLVKWQGFTVEEATWEPLRHMNDNCRELIAKARALFAWRRPGAVVQAPPAAATPAPLAAPAPRPAPAPAPAAAEEPAAEGAYEPAASHRAAPAPSEQRRPAQLRAPGGAEPDSLKRAGSGAQAGSQPKRPRPQAAQPNGAAQHASSGSVPAPPPPPAASGAPGDVPKPPPRPAAGGGEAARKQQACELKCICGAAEKVASGSKDDFVTCRVCGFWLHLSCVEGALRRPAPDDYVCAPCRLEKVDEFHPAVGPALLKYGYASSSSTFSLTFTSQAAQWKKQQWAVHLRSVDLSSSTDLSGPAWPHRVQGKLNGRQCVAIDPPKHLHVRREQCYNLTPLLRPGSNTLELKFSNKPDRPKEEPETHYCVGVVLTRPRSVASIISRIKGRSSQTVISGRARVEGLIAEVARREAGQDECKVTGNFGRMLKPLCPVSFCPIEEAAIGRLCNHVQVFDLQSYIAVNQRMRSLDKRWTCPVCSLPLRPDDVVLDPFSQGILDTLRGDEDLVEAIVFNEDCSWSTISAVKEDKQRAAAGDGDEGAPDGAELIDLSDSE